MDKPKRKYTRRKKRKYTRKINKQNVNKKERTQKDALQNHISYLYGKIETIIDLYANSADISGTTLARELGALLQRKEGRKVLGA